MIWFDEFFHEFVQNLFKVVGFVKAVIDIPFQISQSFDLPFLLFYFKDPWFLEYFGQDYSMEAKNTSIHSWMRLKRKWALGQPLVDSQVKFLCSVANMFFKTFFTKFGIFFFISCKKYMVFYQPYFHCTKGTKCQWLVVQLVCYLLLKN